MSDSPTDPFSASVLSDSSNPSDGRAGNAARAAHRPVQVGPYRILELLGEGGMGEVYKAERRFPIQQTVAIKIIKLGFDSREIVARFESERQALAFMDHPGIAKVLDAGTTEAGATAAGTTAAGRPYFVMDYVAGKPITQFCDDLKLSIRDRLHLFGGVCDAINHAHTKAIIHRDIKPSNVLAHLQDGAPAVKVIDFGIAKALTSARLSDRTFNTAHGTPIGTFDCMSPEQVDGSPDIDTRTDVYSLGVLLYELLTGAKPFDQTTLASASDAEVKRIIREVNPPRPSTRWSNLDREAARTFAERRQAKIDALTNELRGELEWIPLMAMRKERARRYASPLQLKEDIQNYLDGKPLLAGPERRSYRVKKYLRRHQRGVLASATMLIFVMAGTALYIHNIRAEQAKTKFALIESERQRAEAQKQASIARDSSSFLADVFSSAAPDRAMGAKVTIVDAMKKAAASLDAGELKVEPATESMVRYTVGTTLHALGFFDEALPQLRTALELNHKYLSPDDPQIPETLMSLGVVLQEQDKAAEAEPLFREALRLRESAQRPDQVSIANALSYVGGVLKYQGKVVEAEPMYRRVVEIRRAALPPGDPEISSSLNNLSALLWSQKRLAEAEPLCREALRLRQQYLPAGHPNIAQSLNNLAALLRDQKKYAEAEPLCREALEMRRKLLPPLHPDLAGVLHTMAWILQAEGKVGEAEPLAREVLAIRRASLAADHPLVAIACDDLAWVLQMQGKLDETVPLYQEALKIRAVRFGASAPITQQNASRLAQALENTHHPAEAATLRAEYKIPPPTTRPASLPTSQPVS